MSALASRRALLGSITALPALAAPALAAAPSDLVMRCDFAIQHGNWINRTCVADGGWPEEKMGVENDRYWEAFDGAYEQTSATLADALAKARLALHEMRDAGELENGNPGVMLAADALAEIIALCA